MTADSSTPPELPSGWRDRFVDALLDAFQTWEDMGRLFYLGLDESLERHIVRSPMEIVGVKVLQWAEGSGRLHDLVKAACRHRPQHAELQRIAGEIGITPEAQDATQERVARVQAGLRAARHVVREAFAGIRANLASAGPRLERAAAYKAIHDRLHEFQFRCFAPIVSAARTFPQGDTVVELQTYRLSFGTELEKIREIAASRTLKKDDFPWIEDNLGPAYDLLSAAIAETSLAKLQEVIRSLRNVMQLQPTIVNTLLLRTVEDLDLAKLVETLEALIAGLEDGDELRPWIERAVADLHVLYKELTALASNHRDWQRADNSLRMFEATLGQSSDGLGAAWSVVDRDIRRVLSGADPSTTELRNLADLVAGALTKGPGGNVFVYFSRFHSLASNRFYQVDKDLNQLCERLAPVGKDLQSVAERVDGDA